MKLERKPAYGPNNIPLIGVAIKIQLYQTPENGKGKLINESQITLKAAKTEINEIKDDFLNFSINEYMLVPFILTITGFRMLLEQ